MSTVLTASLGPCPRGSSRLSSGPGIGGCSLLWGWALPRGRFLAKTVTCFLPQGGESPSLEGPWSTMLVPTGEKCPPLTFFSMNK